MLSTSRVGVGTPGPSCRGSTWVRPAAATNGPSAVMLSRQTDFWEQDSAQPRTKKLCRGVGTRMMAVSRWGGSSAASGSVFWGTRCFSPASGLRPEPQAQGTPTSREAPLTVPRFDVMWLQEIRPLLRLCQQDMAARCPGGRHLASLLSTRCQNLCPGLSAPLL